MAGTRYPQPLLDDPEWLRQRYVVERMTIGAIGAQLRCHGQAVSAALRRHGIEVRVQRSSVAMGQRFGRLVVQEEAGRTGNRARRWLCRCDCGETKIIDADSLARGATRSCGCLLRESKTTHGCSQRSLTYYVWQSMVQRCRNPNHRAWKDYGGRGITVCERWQGPDGFSNFLADMGEKPDGLSLDRMDNESGYSPDNCRWATWVEQNNNRRRPR